MELGIAGDPMGDSALLSVKLEPSSPEMPSPLINGHRSLMDYGGDSLLNGHSDYDHDGLLSESYNHNLSEDNVSDSDSSLQRTSYSCDTGDLHCASSPESYDNGKLDSSTVEFSLCTSSTLPSDLDSVETPKRICLVCGDIASGYHYGVASCEACKAFFKRTIQGNIEYSCPASGICEITKRRRKACQACRFQKCLRMGMLKEGVRLDRVRGGRQKYKRSMDSPISVIPSTPIKKTCIERNMKQPRPSQEVSTALAVDFSNPAIASNKMLAALLMIEPEKVYAMPDPSLPVDEYKFLSTLTDLFDRELVATIGWAKQVPGFVNLSLPDQMNLLQCTWLDVLNLNVAYRSSPYKGILAFADDFHLSEEDADNYQAPVEVDTLQRKLAKKLTRVNITREEYVLLKGIILFNPDAPLENPESVKQLQEKLEDALAEYVKASGLGNSRRIMNLLLLLPLLAQEKVMTRQYWQSVKKEGKVVMHKLLSEMLDANS